MPSCKKNSTLLFFYSPALQQLFQHFRLKCLKSLFLFLKQFELLFFYLQQFITKCFFGVLFCIYFLGFRSSFNLSAKASRSFVQIKCFPFSVVFVLLKFVFLKVIGCIIISMIFRGWLCKLFRHTNLRKLGVVLQLTFLTLNTQPNSS